ncbi:alanine racemase [Gynuella sp.]|uniref:alanine racemase n=1 Tax=Gynuella sp. TaxID=2969146 RepID=UPI003D0EF3EA
MSRGTLATVDIKALKHNLNTIRQHAPESKIWAVVKANGYGHGAISTAKALTSLADGFAVSTFVEALELQQAGITRPILLLEGCVTLDQTQEAISRNMEMVIHNEIQLDWLTQISNLSSQKIWLKIDTGMHRLGLSPEVGTLWATKLTQEYRCKVAYITHFACADTPEHPFNQLQLNSFAPFTKQMGCEFSMANSAAIFSLPQSRGNWIRPGIALYGASPFSDKSAQQLNLVPAMTLTAPVIAIHQIPKGQHVGYGANWCAERNSTIATLAIGYGDGYPRHAGNNTPTWINGHIAPVVGRVSMDMLTIDITDIAGIDIGNDVELWGKNLSVDHVASHVGTIGYELLTRLSARIERVYN